MCIQLGERITFQNRKRFFALAVFATLGMMVVGSTVTLAARWSGHFTGGGQAVTFDHPHPLPPTTFEPPFGTKLSFHAEVRVDELVLVEPPPPRLPALRSAPDATILAQITWVDHSFSPPRVFQMKTPEGFFCRSASGDTNVSGIGTDSYLPGEPVRIGFAADNPTNSIRVFAHFPIPPLVAPLPPPYYTADADVTGGKLHQHSCQ